LKGVNPVAAFIIILLLFIIVVSVIRNGSHHKAAVARRAARKQEFRDRTERENDRLHTVYNRDSIRELNKEVGFVEAARRRHAEFKGTN
jgi:flagellar biosynthesis/type III secretory pathway M-ring protein FliF/YscJ